MAGLYDPKHRTHEPTNSRIRRRRANQSTQTFGAVHAVAYNMYCPPHTQSANRLAWVRCQSTVSPSRPSLGLSNRVQMRFTSHRTYNEATAACYDSRTEHVTTLYGRHVAFLDAKSFSYEGTEDETRCSQELSSVQTDSGAHPVA
jgi:hypothetical protein